MILALLVIALAFTWLLYETDFLRVRLPVGKVKPKYAKYEVYNMLRKRKVYWNETVLYKGGNLPVDHSPDGEPCYQIILNPGIKNVLCGWDWLNEHCADMVDYQPKVEMAIGGVRYNMTIKQPAIIKDIMRVNKLTKKQKLAYA